VRRREVITLLGGAAATWPLAARAQQPAKPLVGYLGSETPALFATRLRAFREGLSEMGYVEGRNVAIEYRWADGQYDRLPALAADLVRRQVSVIATPGSSAAALAAKAATSTVPIVFYIGGDPVELELVGSLARPGGNVTGVSTLSVDIGPKLLELLHELVPTATMLALLVNPTNPETDKSRDLQAVARSLGVQLLVLNASTERDFETVFATLTERRAGGLVIGPHIFFTSRSDQLAALALRHAIPTIFQFRQFAAAGGLMSYGGNLMDAHRLAGVYTGRILKGEKPADLPVQQSTKIELFINLRTAKALGLTVPTALLVRADEVIE
jgi:putative ABC transport system substrate-binding protein